MTRTLILGAGFGGLAVATELRQRLGSDHEIIIVDRGQHFLMGLRKLWALVGLGSLDGGSRSRSLLDERGIQFLQREVVGIDPDTRTVATDGGPISGDYLVVALGAEPRPDLVPGLAVHGHNVWDAREVPGLAEALSGFEGGRIVVAITGVPYTCPPAPFECSMLIDDHLRERGLRDGTELTVSTLQPILMPNAGREGSAWLGDRLAERGIRFRVGQEVQSVEAGRVVLSDSVVHFDILIGVPPHRPPPVVSTSGLTAGGVWIAVDPATLRTSFDKVYAIGDVTKIELANGLSLPKAGVMAELEGTRVAAAIAADVSEEEPPPAFDGRGYCFMEMGKTTATLIEGDFFAAPEPRVALGEVSPEHAEAKHRFEAERLQRWFGG
jgi:sulfide:quinone oxidoreductase